MAASSSTAAASFGSWSASTVSASAANARSRSRSQRTSYRRAATSQSSAGCRLSACPSSERPAGPARQHPCWPCLLYTSDAADEEDSVDLGGRRIIKKKKKKKEQKTRK